MGLSVWIHVGGIKVGDSWVWREGYGHIYPGMQWYPGDPNNHEGRENCLGVGKKGYVGYVDISCYDNPAAFICENVEDL